MENVETLVYFHQFEYFSTPLKGVLAQLYVITS